MAGLVRRPVPGLIQDVFAATRRSFVTVGANGIQFNTKGIPAEHRALLSPDVEELVYLGMKDFGARYEEVMQVRAAQSADRKAARERGEPWEFNVEAPWVATADWSVAPVPEDLTAKARPIEITGPMDQANMMHHALKTGRLAETVAPDVAHLHPVKSLQDWEDASVPTLEAEVRGAFYLMGALRGDFEFTNAKGKTYTVTKDDAIAHPIPRLPGLHLREAGVIDHGNRAVPNHLLTAILFQYHIVPLLLERGMSPALFLPKLQTMAGATLSNDVLNFVERETGHELGSTKVTVMVETLPGALNMEAMMYAMRKRCVSANAGRWDYLDHWMKEIPDVITPDRQLLTMQTAHMEAYQEHVVDLCTRRGAVPMGGMEAKQPTVKDPKKREALDEEMRVAARREKSFGFAGKWGSHPDAIETLMRVFVEETVDARKGRSVSVEDLTTLPEALRGPESRTEAGLRLNISVCLQYVCAWIEARGAVALDGLMEDMATAEMSRTQIWQWLQYQAEMTFADGSIAKLTPEKFTEIFDSELAHVKDHNEVPLAIHNIEVAARIIRSTVMDPELEPFIADRAMAHLNAGIERPAPLMDRHQSWAATPEQLGFHGSNPAEHIGGELTKVRSAQTKSELLMSRSDGFPSVIMYQGAITGVDARAIVEGGNKPYGGGWQFNGAEEGLPDTLNLDPRDPANVAAKFNKLLYQADRIEWSMFQKEMDHINALPESQRQEAAQRASNMLIHYMAQEILVDGEQGWCSPERTRQLVELCIRNGVSRIHVEDQDLEKVCGHLGGKTLQPIHLVRRIFESANAAAQDILGPGQITHRWMDITSRSDALSATKMRVNEKLRDPEHPDHRFIDFDAVSEDGKYWYLKGYDPETEKKAGRDPVSGLPWGLAHAAARQAQLVKVGLAKTVWMETPNANMETMVLYRKELLRLLEGSDQWPMLMYNISPSFKWYANFLKDSGDFSVRLQEYIVETLAPMVKPESEDDGASFAQAQYELKEWVKLNGDGLCGDMWMGDDYVKAILCAGIDSYRGEQAFKSQAQATSDFLRKQVPGTLVDAQLTAVAAALSASFNPLGEIQHQVACSRLEQFMRVLSSVWGSMYFLNTLPAYRSAGVNMTKLSHDMRMENLGMLGYAKNIEWKEEALKREVPHFNADNHQAKSGAALLGDRSIAFGGSGDVFSGSTEETDEDVFAAK